MDLNTNDVYDVVYDGRIHLSSQGTELEVKGPETVPAWTAPTPLFLFASYTVADTGEIDNVGNFAHLEFYSFEIFSSTDPSSLLHKYVPACDEDGTACVADLVTRRLLYGTGSTPTMGFKLDEADALTGPVLPPGYATAEYLQSHGTEYVDLGVKFNGMWTYTLVFSPDASDLTCGVFGARHTSPAGVEAIAMYSQLHHSLFGIDMHGRLFDSGARVTFSGTRPDTPYRAVISSETCTIEPLDGSSPLVVMPAKTKVELGNTFETAWLFAVHGQDSWHRTPMKFYSLSILSSRKALHRNYLPVRNWQTDAEPEVYESCLGELLPRLGEGRLTVPPPAMRNVCWYDRRLRMSVRRPASSTAAGFTVYLAGNNLLDDVDAWTAWGTSFAFPDAFAAQDTADVSLGPIPSAYSVACVRFSDGTWSEAIVAPDERAVDGTVLTLR